MKARGGILFMADETGIVSTPKHPFNRIFVPETWTDTYSFPCGRYPTRGDFDITCVFVYSHLDPNTSKYFITGYGIRCNDGSDSLHYKKAGCRTMLTNP